MRLLLSCAALALVLTACSEQAAETTGTIGAVSAEHGETANDSYGVIAVDRAGAGCVAEARVGIARMKKKWPGN